MFFDIEGVNDPRELHFKLQVDLVTSILGFLYYSLRTSLDH
jgi:hypothetical protein